MLLVPLESFGDLGESSSLTFAKGSWLCLNRVLGDCCYGVPKMSLIAGLLAGDISVDCVEKSRG